MKCELTRKFHENPVPLPTYLSFHHYPKILQAFQKTFPSKMMPTKCPAKEKKMRQEKKKKRGGEKVKK